MTGAAGHDMVFTGQEPLARQQSLQTCHAPHGPDMHQLVHSYTSAAHHLRTDVI